jgi:hypothetical protein
MEQSIINYTCNSYYKENHIVEDFNFQASSAPSKLNTETIASIEEEKYIPEFINQDIKYLKKINSPRTLQDQEEVS